MTGCVHRRVITEDLNRKASSAIGDFFIVVANIWVGFVAFKALFFASKQTASLLRPSPSQAAACPAEHPYRPSRPAEHPLRPSRPAEHPCTGPLGQRSTSPALTASGAPLHRLSRPAEHLSGPHGQRSTPATASGAPLRQSRPAEHLSGPHGQRSTLHRPSRPAEHLSGPHGQRSTPAPALSASGAPLQATAWPAKRL
ncbi:putative NAD(+)--arginine ADP-ribosyltransferase Mav [Drosophila sulfurigaster albostrigata]|uniref:putative NAD(+)--arginine ADP-ribosyltransferase Mav n=1 Tax=Drosophila sulfurigaster albostrigata TaxID=89887 RepID=UPI002D21C4AD|nr:putative NAD(+)--arginine ADP-ribosyltransferase Mav [Drosophila sulfurigaster albostrigata]